MSHLPNKTHKTRYVISLSSDGRASRRSLAWLTFLLLAWGLMALAVFHQQDLIDWWRLRDYNPPATVKQLASQTSMTPYTQKAFYVNYPKLADKTTFTKYCPGDDEGELTIVMGCYRSGQNGIFLHDIKDPRLNGVEQVTAAHEVLHAIYERLSGEERQEIDRQLLSFYHHGLKDQRVIKVIESYKRSEPNDLVNEMHSIFGTEIAKLPNGLERHYKKYFENRAKIVSYASRYQSEFTSRQELRKQYESQMNALADRIVQGKADLASKEATIDSLYAKLSGYRESGNYEAYNAGVAQYSGLAAEFNGEVSNLNSLIDQYNEILARRNQLALEENQLIENLSPSANPLNR